MPYSGTKTRLEGTWNQTVSNIIPPGTRKAGAVGGIGRTPVPVAESTRRPGEAGGTHPTGILFCY